MDPTQTGPWSVHGARHGAVVAHARVGLHVAVQRWHTNVAEGANRLLSTRTRVPGG